MQPAAAAGGGGGGGGGIVGAAAAYHGQQLQQAAAEVLELIAEDVEVLRREWEQRKKPHLERERVTLWRGFRGAGMRLRLESDLEKHQEKLREASLEMARGHADNVAKYKKERSRFREVRGWGRGTCLVCLEQYIIMLCGDG
jgi:hypothetical protein